MNEITKQYYWRCPNSKCGSEKGGGRLCTKCYGPLVDKTRCVTCRQTLADNPITDPNLLPFLFSIENDGLLSATVVTNTFRGLIELGFADAVSKHSMRCPLTVSVLREMVIAQWFLFPVEQLRLFYAKLEPTIIMRLSNSSTDVGWGPIHKAAAKRPPWLLDSARWLIEWRNNRRCVSFVNPQRYSDVMDGEPRLLAMCETEEEFKVLRRLATGVEEHVPISLAVIMAHTEVARDCHGKRWVFDLLFGMLGRDKNAEPSCKVKFKWVAYMFPYEKLYLWAAKHHIVVTEYHVPNFDLAANCGIAPILYGCHAKGLYAQTSRLTLEPVPIHFRDGTKTLFIPPNVDKRVLYVDCSHDSMKLDWLFNATRKIHHIDASGLACRVDVCDDGVELYIGDVQQVTRSNDKMLPLKITRFASLTLQSVNRNKRKLNLVE